VWRTLHKEELNDLYPSPDFWGGESENKEKARDIAGYHGKTEVHMWFYWGKIMETNHIEDTVADGTIVLR